MVKDFFKSMASSIDSRVTSPVVGTFFTSWALCNWDKLVLLVWGEGTVNLRVRNFTSSLSVLDINFLVVPVVFTVIYLFCLPWINYWIYKAQSICEEQRYSSAVCLDIKKESKRGELVKATKKADMQDQVALAEIEADKQNLEADTRRRISEAEKAEENKIQASKEAEKAYDEAESAKVQAQIVRDDAEKKQIKTDREKQEFEKITAVHKDKLATLRFPAAYSLINALSESIAEDNARFKTSTLSDVIAATFGYGSFDDLISDKNFNHETLMKTNYLAYDDKFTPALVRAIDGEGNEDWDENWLFDHIHSLLENLYNITLSSIEGIVDDLKCKIDDIDELMELIDDEMVNGTMAITNACFDEVDSLDFLNYSFDKSNGLTLSFTAIVSGSTHENKAFCGDSINVSFNVHLPIVVGAYGLGQYVKEVTSAQLEDYSDPEDWAEQKGS